MHKLGALLLCVATGVALVAVIVALAVFRPDISAAQFHIWFSFVFFTMLLAAVLTKLYWSVRRVRKVWVLLVLFMLAHTVAYMVLLHYFQDWPSFTYILTGPLEIMLFATIAWFCLKVNPPTPKGWL